MLFKRCAFFYAGENEQCIACKELKEKNKLLQWDQVALLVFRIFLKSNTNTLQSGGTTAKQYSASEIVIIHKTECLEWTEYDLEIGEKNVISVVGDGSGTVQ